MVLDPSPPPLLHILNTKSLAPHPNSQIYNPKNRKIHTGFSCLHLAAKMGDIEIISALVELGAQLDMTDIEVR